MLTDQIYELLDTALDSEISEWDFWDMTIAEVNRAVLSRARVIKANDKKKAEFDYMLAQLIGINVGRAFSGSSVNLPSIEEVYPVLFQEDLKEIEEEKARRTSELSALRFMEFAKAHNKKFKKGVGN